MIKSRLNRPGFEQETRGNPPGGAQPRFQNSHQHFALFKTDLFVDKTSTVRGILYFGITDRVSVHMIAYR